MKLKLIDNITNRKNPEAWQRAIVHQIDKKAISQIAKIAEKLSL